MAGAAVVGCSPSLQARATAAQIAMCETRLRMGAIIAARRCSVNLTPVSAGNNVKPAMPIYEYRCTECHTRFSQQQGIEEHGRKRPACPRDPGPGDGGGCPAVRGEASRARGGAREEAGGPAGRARTVRARARGHAGAAGSGGTRPAAHRGGALGGTCLARPAGSRGRSEEHTSELQSRPHLVCRLLLEKKKKNHLQSPQPKPPERRPPRRRPLTTQQPPTRRPRSPPDKLHCRTRGRDASRQSCTTTTIS